MTPPGGPRGPARDGARDGSARGGGARDGAPGGRVVGGLHPVRELLRAGGSVQRVLVAEGRSEGEVVDEVVAAARARGVEVVTVPREELDRLAPGLVHQGVLAQAPPFPTVTLETILARAEAAGEAPLIVALDGVTDPHNLGSIARSAEAVGAHGLVLPGRRSATVTPTVEKAAAGALAHLPVAVVPNLVRALVELKERGLWVLGLDVAGEPLANHPLAGEAAVLVVGAEGSGLARLTRERCDALVGLPMRGRVGSLNASVAVGVSLFLLRGARDAPR